MPLLGRMALTQVSWAVFFLSTDFSISLIPFAYYLLKFLFLKILWYTVNVSFQVAFFPKIIICEIIFLPALICNASFLITFEVIMSTKSTSGPHICFIHLSSLNQNYSFNFCGFVL